MKTFVTQIVYEQTGGMSLMGRARTATGVYMTQAAISDITLKIYDKTTQGTPINGSSGATVSVSGTVYDTLSLVDPVSGSTIWTKDSTGYNFLYRTASTDLPEGNRTYLFEFTFTAADSSGPFYAVFEITTGNLLSV